MLRVLTVVALLAFAHVAFAATCFDVDFETDQNGNPMGNNVTIGNSWNLYFITSARSRNARGGSTFTNSALRTYNSSSFANTDLANNGGSGDPDLGTPNRLCPGCPPSGSGRSIQCPGLGANDSHVALIGDPKAARNSNCVRRNLVAVIQQPGNGYIPNDAQFGGEIWFNFTQDVIISRIGVLDVDTNEPGGDAITYDSTGHQLSIEHFGANGDNTWSNNPIDQAGVRRFKVILAGSGAITNFQFCIDDEECPRALCAPCDADTRVSSINCLLNGNVVHHHTAGTALGVAFSDTTDLSYGSGCTSNGPQ